MKVLIYSAIFNLIFFFSLLTYANNLETLKNSSVNWFQNILEISSIGKPSFGKNQLTTAKLTALQNARHALQRNFLEVLSSIRLNSHQTLLEIFQTDPSLIDECLETFYQSSIQNISIDSSNIYYFDIKIPLFGEIGIAKTIFYKYYQPNRPNSISFLRDKNILTSFISKIPSKLYTGVIIDASHLQLNPCLMPKIKNSFNKTIYDFNTINFQFAITQGIVSYAPSLKTAKKNTLRIGKHPLLIQAQATSGTFQTDLVILNWDANRLLYYNNITHFLEKGKVIIIL